MTTPVFENGPRRVWVVDDDETLLMLAQEALAGDFAVEVFADARAAAQALAQGLPDLVVLDVMLPGMNGYQFCAQLRARPSGQDVPVLMMTFLDDAEAIHKAYEAGATGFVTKPINWVIELHRLRYMLRAAEIARELRQKEEETRVAKEAWEKTFQAIHDLVTVVDGEHRILQANAATVTALGLPLGEILGRRSHELFENLAQPGPNCPIARVLRTGQPATAEIKYHRPASVRLISASPIRAADGQITQIVQVARDLTEQKQLEAQLRHVQKMEAVGTLAGGVAHEFNNLLQAVLGSAELLRMAIDRDSAEQSEIQSILDAAKRGGTLTRQMLTFSRRGALWTEKLPVNLNDIVTNVRTMLNRTLPKNITIRLELAPDLKKIKADADQLQQVLVNLAMNSVQAMPNGGEINIRTSNCARTKTNTPDHVCLSFGDNGHGMDQPTLDRIYEPFFTTRGVGKGTGLGLSVVFGIVKEHLGDITCASQPGVGTRFDIHLPVVGEARTTPRIPIVAPAHDPAGPATILVVDDEEPLRKALLRVLGRMGYQVLAAPDAPSALKTFADASRTPDLVVLDLGLPGMSGWECLEQLRIMNPAARVLVATGYGGDDLEERARALGAAGILMKPYDLAALVEKVRGLLPAPPVLPETARN